MDNKQSGMVTPPIVSPRPIQNQKPLTADESWKIVGSPPRRPLLSPPEERERNRGLQDSDLTTVEGNSTRTIATVTSTVNNDITEFADSTASSVSTGIGNESSPVSSALSSFSPGGSTRHSLTSRHNLADQNQNTGPLSSLMAPSTSHIDRFIAGNGLSPFDEDSPAKESEQQPLHFKSFSTGTPSNVHLDAATSLLDNDDVGLSQSLTGLGREATVTSTGLKQGSIGLESSLSRRPYFWNPIKNVNSQTSTKASSSGRLDAIGPNSGRTARSLSFSDTSFSTTFGLSSNNLTLDQEDEDVLRYRPPLPTMEEETEEPLEPRISRTRSFSTSATLGSNAFPTLSNPMFSGRSTQNAFDLSDGSFATAGLTRDDDKPPLHRKLSGGLSAWPNSTVSGSPPTSHRRAMTSASSYNTQIWESSCPFQPLTSPVRREHHMERQPIPRRFSLAPSSDFQTYDSFLDGMNAGNSSNIGSYNRYANKCDKRSCVV
ncbi:hypothetical protein BCR41DRAFT_79093 [Lobosporangium transversale]|uniref:Uncharacterized protein n=1 Tax=Lobosporangium transversale TaxID=64571 RepID=A0A1Y2GLK5_9FUNG|nr:hypothetical protein BCR41DRAFT_79093 [Lobosporangium transversale]ORZ14896.1 hypothetical protein BCR41DRAFT_79093 [Lobosporangium transversale]|eukprot:XP_021881028.1 hypothetical protein BCR41DRAFT_79093 [Lobosporangium transversale]